MLASSVTITIFCFISFEAVAMDLMTFQESIKKCGCPRNKIFHLITSSENNLIEIHISRSPPQNSLSVQLFSLDMLLCQHFLPPST